MTATTQPRKTMQLEGNPLPVVLAYPIKANQVMYQGTIAMLDSSGRLIAGATVTGAQTIGKFDNNEPVTDTTGLADGDVIGTVYPGVWLWASGSGGDVIAADDVGQLAYTIDNQTVGLTDGGATRSIAGTIFGVTSSGNVYVYSNLSPGVDGSALAAEIAARLAYEAAVALTTTPGGASLVGLYDAAGLYAGTTVEAAMAELIGGARIATLADGGLTPGVCVVHEFAVPDAATGHTDYVIADKFEITEVVVRKDTTNGGAGDVISIGNGATAITDAMVLNITAKTLVRAGTIDAAQAVIAAAGTLRINWTKVTNVKCQVTIFGIKRA